MMKDVLGVLKLANMFEEDRMAISRRVRSLENDEDLTVFYGSSSLRLWTSLEQDFPHLHCLNAGFGGSTFLYCIKYFEEIFQGLYPSHIVIYVGDNDLGDGASSKEVYQRFLRLIELIKQQYPAVKISFMSIKPSPSKDDIQDRIVETNQLIHSFIQKEEKMHYIDIYTPMLSPQGKSRPELFEEDGLHMNEKGYDIWRKVFGEL